MVDEEMAFVERVARAIYHGGRPKKAWDDLAEEYKRKFRVQARFAIDEMREMSTEMRIAMGQAIFDAGFNDWQSGWSAAIDAALKETA